MDDVGPDNIDANQDPQMQAFDVSPMVLSLEAATILGMCATVVVGNSLVCVLGYRKPGQSGSSVANAILLKMTVLSVFTALLTMPLMVAAILQFRWRFGDALCRGTGTLTFVFVVLASLVVCLVFVNRCCALLCCTDEHQNTVGKLKQRWLVFVLVFLLGSVVGLALLIDWRMFVKNPTRLLCRLANSPGLIAYRIFYSLFSVFLIIVVMILLVFPKAKQHS